MSEQPEFGRFFIGKENDEIQIEPSEYEILYDLKLPDKVNNAARDKIMSSEELPWIPGQALALEAPQPGHELRLVADGKKREIGILNPITGMYEIYPEILEEPEEAKLLQPFASVRREEAIADFNSRLSPSPRIECGHQEIAALHRYHNAVLHDGILDMISDRHNFEVPDVELYNFFNVDSFTIASVGLASTPAIRGVVEPDYMVRLRLLASYRRMNDGKHRTVFRTVDLAKRSVIQDVNSPMEPIEIQGVPLIDREELERIMRLVEYSKALRELIPNLSTETLGVNLQPKEEPNFPSLDSNWSQLLDPGHPSN